MSLYKKTADGIIQLAGNTKGNANEIVTKDQGDEIIDALNNIANKDTTIKDDVERIDNKVNGLLNLKSRVITAGSTDETYTLTADNGKYVIFAMTHPQLSSTVSVVDSERYGQTSNEYGMNVIDNVIKAKVKANNQLIIFWNDNADIVITKD